MSIFLTSFKLIFAKRGEAVSGGNFHGEYPAKVRRNNYGN